MTRLLIQVAGESGKAVIVEDVREAERLWPAWCERRYAKGLPLGGAVIDRVVRCACGGWARWILGRCERCLSTPQEWRESTSEVAAFDHEAERRGWMPRPFPKASGE